MRRSIDFARMTIVGGVLYLLPVVLIAVVVSKAIGLMRQVSEPVVQRLGVETFGGVAASTILTLTLLVFLAFLAGLFSRTATGRSLLAWLAAGIAAVFPRYGFLEEIAQSFEQNSEGLAVVLVPNGAGWSPGLLVETHDEWCTVFQPGSPDLLSGSVAYVRVNDLRRTDVKVSQLWTILRGRGRGSAPVYAQLARGSSAHRS